MNSDEDNRIRLLVLNTEVIHQMVIIAAQFVFVQLFAKIVFYLVFVPLEGGYNIGDLELIDFEGHKECNKNKTVSQTLKL